MKPFTFTLRVEEIDNRKINWYVSRHPEENILHYTIETGTVSFSQENLLSVHINKNLHQLKRILRSAIHGKIGIGQTIHCVFLDDFYFLQEEDFSRFIRLDLRGRIPSVTVSDSGFHGVHRIFADGSCNPENRQSGHGGFTETPEGERQLFSRSFSGGSSNLAELLAVTEGLQRLAEQEQIQINTDSRFIIRGLVQWVHFWRHNNWQTAYGQSVKHVAQWQTAFNLCKGKYLEFKWIKGHSGHEKHDICHLLAKATARQSGDT